MAETTAQKELEALQSLQLSRKEVLEVYSKINLTEEELIECLIWGKQKKEKELERLALEQKIAYNRKMASEKMSFDVIKTFMVNRANDIFKFEFVIDDNNHDTFDLLCHYFTGNIDGFTKQAKRMGVDMPSIDKGLLLAGNFGTGKTVLMSLFMKNTRQVYFMRPAKRISQEYLTSRDKVIPEEYLTPFKNAINDAATFFQPLSGLCIDDLGSESEKVNYGNKANVIGDLIEARYHDKFTGVFLHATTNLSSQELIDFYGERVVSRMKEIFNFVELAGEDRRR